MIRIIIPVYNEQENISKCIQETAKNLKDQQIKFYVINDGSTDRSLSILTALSKNYPIKIINHRPNKGIAQAFRSGILAVSQDSGPKDVVFLIEGDNTSDPTILKNILKKIEQGADVVIASRYQKGGGYKNFPLDRLIFSQTVNLVFRLLFHHQKAKDYTIFYRAYTAKIIKEFLNKYQQKAIESKYFVANTEVLVKIMTLTKKIDEVPLIYDYGNKKGKSGLRVKTNLWEFTNFIIKNLTKR